jgi:putative transposase
LKAAVPIGVVVYYDPLIQFSLTPKETATMSSYQTLTSADTQPLSDFLSRNGQLLLPMVQLIEQSRAALDDVVDVTGRAIIELILRVSADTLAGPRTPGKKTGDIRHHGSQDGIVFLKERKLRVKRPRCPARIEMSAICHH